MFVTLVSTYIIILLIPILTGFITYLRTLATLEDETNRANAVMLEQVRSVVDDQLLSAKQLAYEISFKQSVVSLLYKRKSFDTDDRLNVSNMVQEFAILRNVNSVFIDDFFVYFANRGIIINSAGLNEVNTYFNGDSEYSEVSSYNINKFILSDGSADGFVTLNSEKDENKKLIFFILNMQSGVTQKGKVVVKIGQQYIRNKLNPIEGIEKSDVYIIDGNGSVIMYPSSGRILSVKVSEFKNKQDVINTVQDGKEQIISYRHSELNNWLYVSVVPKNVLMQKVQYIKIIIAIGFLLSIFIGGILIFMFARRNYAPVKKIVGDISQELGGELYQDTNEFDIISTTFKRISFESKGLKAALTEQIPLLKENFFHQLLRGRYSNQREIEENLCALELEFDEECFLSVAILVEDLNISRQNVNKVFIAIYEILKRMNYNGYLLEDGKDTFILILNIPCMDYDELKPNLDIIFEKILQCMTGISLQSISIGVGEIKKSLMDLHHSYRESKSALRYKLVLGKGKVLYFAELQKDSGAYYYPAELKLRLNNNLKIGDYKKVEQVIDEIFDKNFTKNTISPDYATYLFIDLINTIYKVMDETRVRISDILDKQTDPVELVQKCQTTEEIKKQVLVIAKSLL